MGEVKERCKLLEEHKYWNEFEPNTYQFFKVMICDFQQRLRVPKKFVRKFRGGLLSPMRLKGPSGDTWTVEAVRTVDQVVLEKGWGKFVQDHGLKRTDFLVFRYAGDSSFNVLIFDNSGCERAGSYFVNKHGISCSENGCAMERNQEEEVPSDSEDCMMEKNTKKAHHEVIDLDDDDDEEEGTKQEVKAKPASSSFRHKEPKKESGVKPPIGSWKDAMHDGPKCCPKPVAANQKPEEIKGKKIQGVKLSGTQEDRTQRESRCPEAASIMSKHKQSVRESNTMWKSMKEVPQEVMDSDDDDTMQEVNAKPASFSFRQQKPKHGGVQAMKPRKDAVQYWKNQIQGTKLAATHSMQYGNVKHTEWVEVKRKGRKRKIQDDAEQSSTKGEEASDTKPVVKLEHKPKIIYSYVPK